MELLLIIVLVVVALVLVGGAAALLSRRRPGAVESPERPRVERAPSKVDDGSDTAVVDEAGLDDAVPEIDEPDVEPEDVEPEEVVTPTFRERLGRARDGFTGALGGLRGRKVDDESWEELEEALIMADVGVPTTMAMLDRVRERCKEEKVTDFDGALALLRDEMEVELGDADISLAITGEPAIWMFVGVNGVGKTTTIGKLAKREVDAGQKVVLAAGDTFRAAAAEQLETWANRCDAGFVRGAEGADPGSVVFDAVEHAAAAGASLVLADTAGRLHNKANLMEELRKVRRVAEKGAGVVSEVLLVIDATTGQNGLTQAKQFTEAVDVTGIVLTKLDGSAKGGIVLAIQSELGIPVKLVGLGEGIGDLVEFDPAEFVDALFA